MAFELLNDFALLNEKFPKWFEIIGANSKMFVHVTFIENSTNVLLPMCLSLCPPNIFDSHLFKHLFKSPSLHHTFEVTFLHFWTFTTLYDQYPSCQKPSLVTQHVQNLWQLSWPKTKNKQQLKGKVTISAFSLPSMSKTPSNLFWS
jgi:hypothetical protein